MEKHHCFNTGDLGEVWGRVHVPLAKDCSLHCIYCSYRIDGNVTDSAWRPGTSANTVEGEDAIYEYLKNAFAAFSDVKVIGVSGPGDPLENMSRMRELVSVMQKHYPLTYLCICTNGSMYDQDVQWLLEQRVLRYVTLTINTMDTEKYPQIYRRYCDPAVPRDMWENQLKIIRACVSNGVKVKVNTVCLEGINDQEILRLYARLQQEGVSCFNLMPRINTANGRRCSLDIYDRLMDELTREGYPLMRRCKHCRADHCECGVKGVEKQ